MLDLGTRNEQAPAPAETSVVARPVPRWAWHRRLYDWMLRFADSRHATLALAIFSFTEAIFFPIPPIVLQVPLTLGQRRRAWWYAWVCTITSVAGGLVGYALGAWATDLGLMALIERLFGETATTHATETIRAYAANLVLLTGVVVAVHPYKLFTLCAGIVGVQFVPFVVASLVGRAALFYAVAALLWFFGAPVRAFIDRYFNLLTILLGVLLVAFVVVVKLM